MKHCSKTNDFNSIISVSSSRKLDLTGWLRLGVASVSGASEQKFYSVNFSEQLVRTSVLTETLYFSHWNHLKIILFRYSFQ